MIQSKEKLKEALKWWAEKGAMFHPGKHQAILTKEQYDNLWIIADAAKRELNDT